MIVKDLEDSVRFYRDVLGFSEGYHVETPDGGAITIMKSDGGASVELICNQNFPIGLYSVGTDVDDLDETIKRENRAEYIILGYQGAQLHKLKAKEKEQRQRRE